MLRRQACGTTLASGGASIHSYAGCTVTPGGTSAGAASRVRRFLVERAGAEDRGQLDVYRAFLRIDPNLLRRNGITTLRFGEERAVSDPELIRVRARAVEDAHGIALPRELLATVPR